MPPHGGITRPRPIVITNPRYQEQGEKVMKDLRQSGRSPVQIHSAVQACNMANLIQAHVGGASLDNLGETALLVVGGDGTAAVVMRGLLEAQRKDEKLKPLALLLAAGGFASDGRHATQSRQHRRPSSMLQHSVAAQAHWIERTLGNGVPEKAMFYAGFGKTGFGSGLANDPEYRKMGVTVRKARIGYDTLASSAHIELRQGNNPPERYGDLTFCLNAFMSGLFRINTRLTQPYARVITTPEGFWPGSMRAARLGLPNNIGHLATGMEFDLADDTFAHLDGESPIIVSGGTSVKLKVSEMTYPILMSV